LREIVETLLLTILIFWAVNAATGRFKIDGSSMEPNLHNGQYIIINKLVYQLKDPERGDIVVFQYPNDPSRDFIKRVIGVPGDQVRIEQGRIFINGTYVSEPYIDQLGAYSGTWNLEKDDFFVLGDNRNNSSDSHNWGILPRDNLIGRAWVIYWPFEDWGIVPHHALSEYKFAFQASEN
jgi:signal peptidase I